MSERGTRGIRCMEMYFGDAGWFDEVGEVEPFEDRIEQTGSGTAIKRSMALRYLVIEYVHR
ncbi:uncharacterized protein EAF01_010084 [Botrytis porri]|uniref:Uncharacterized protein n=1 Tax=Botrytis porri TaxID=87229 RepID=A0A4Z1KDH1_9HELO|nr:uncharacterized protein EAF01_010084 [Botrytis porri]KAF7894634.1 hypothetical protein EAF01_010084 [Botrytis porri]TGO83700.1 hypothetical protein BPOR_0605g00050 [Botrytis porri]